MAAKTPLVKWTVDGVLARLTRRQSASVDLTRLVRPLVQAAATLAAWMKRRVTERGDLGPDQSYPGWPTRGWSIKISSAYRDALGLPGRSYRSSDAFHRAAGGGPPGSFSVTGGMWRGLQTRGVGTSAAVIEFARKSEGRGRPEIVARQKGGKPIKVMASERVDNRLKAYAVWSKTHVNVLQPSQAEEVAVAGQVAYDAGATIRRAFGGAGVVVTGADPGLMAAFGRR